MLLCRGQFNRNKKNAFSGRQKELLKKLEQF